jgi:hypothetical protein
VARARHHLAPDTVGEQLTLLASKPVQRHLLPPLLAGAWARRHELRLVDAPLATTDRRLAGATPLAEMVEP